jgi:hypothetical protein
MAVLLPSELLELSIGDDEFVYDLEVAGGAVIEAGTHRWVWQAPEVEGLHEVKVVRQQDAAAVSLRVFVLVPLSRVKDGWLNGYRIGNYPATPLRGLAIYKPPRGLIEVTPEIAEVKISPHFTVGQFLCKQEAGWPRYLALRPRLIQKLELILEAANTAGYRCDSFAVMSGYRTPWYNKVIGNVKYSRHIFGGAADIYIDVAPRDGQMDDLNRDGKVNIEDAAVLYAIIDGLYGKPRYAAFVGGLGQYRRTANHGPFVHVDVRGTRARWGE